MEGVEPQRRRLRLSAAAELDLAADARLRASHRLRTGDIEIGCGGDILASPEWRASAWVVLQRDSERAEEARAARVVS